MGILILILGVVVMPVILALIIARDVKEIDAFSKLVRKVGRIKASDPEGHSRATSVVRDRIEKRSGKTLGEAVGSGDAGDNMAVLSEIIAEYEKGA